MTFSSAVSSFGRTVPAMGLTLLVLRPRGDSWEIVEDASL